MLWSELVKPLKSVRVTGTKKTLANFTILLGACVVVLRASLGRPLSVKSSRAKVSMIEWHDLLGNTEYHQTSQNHVSADNCLCACVCQRKSRLHIGRYLKSCSLIQTYTLAISWSKKIQKQIQSQWTVFHLFFIKSHSNHNLVRGQPGQVQSGLPYVATWPCDAEGPMVSSVYQVDVNEKGQLFHGAKRKPKRSGQDV